ncbi:hypothetical protein OSTOST_23847 [Ostertagia ostertagi]
MKTISFNLRLFVCSRLATPFWLSKDSPKPIIVTETFSQDIKNCSFGTLNEKRQRLSVGLKKLKYNCNLAGEAYTAEWFANIKHNTFRIGGKFKNWLESLPSLINRVEYPKITNPFAKEVGCGVFLTTMNPSGEHHIELRCTFDTSGFLPPR